VSNPIIEALTPHVGGSVPRPLSLVHFVSPRGDAKEMGVILGFRDENGILTQISCYTLSPEEADNFGRYVDETRVWLEAQSGGVPA
jgi:hypothetical protein